MLESVRFLFRNIYIKNKYCSKIFSDKHKNCLLNNTLVESSVIIPSRTTMVVKRLFPPGLYREGNRPKLGQNNFFYELVENTNSRPDPLVNVVLLSYVEGVGNPGDLITMRRNAAYNKLLVTGLADYATQEMIEYSKKIKEDLELQQKQISPSVERCIKYLQASRLSIVMNQFNEWTIEPWHIRASARKAGVHILSDDCIELPVKPIKGPDMSLEGKSFFVTITINKKAKVKVRCHIHHWTSNTSERLPYQHEWWLAPAEMLFAEDELEKKDNPPT